MVIDSSALVAVLNGEPESRAFIKASSAESVGDLTGFSEAID